MVNGAPNPEPDAKHPVKIIVNNRAVEVPGHEVTGAQIKQAAEVPADFKLYGPDGSEKPTGRLSGSNTTSASRPSPVKTSRERCDLSSRTRPGCHRA
jgi:hypothetical protein